jgi:hypothetical protein
MMSPSDPSSICVICKTHAWPGGRTGAARGSSISITDSARSVDGIQRIARQAGPTGNENPPGTGAASAGSVRCVVQCSACGGKRRKPACALVRQQCSEQGRDSRDQPSATAALKAARDTDGASPRTELPRCRPVCEAWFSLLKSASSSGPTGRLLLPPAATVPLDSLVCAAAARSRTPIGAAGFAPGLGGMSSACLRGAVGGVALGTAGNGSGATSGVPAGGGASIIPTRRARRYASIMRWPAGRSECALLPLPAQTVGSAIRRWAAHAPAQPARPGARGARRWDDGAGPTSDRLRRPAT